MPPPEPGPTGDDAAVRTLFVYDHLGYAGGVTHGLTRYCLDVLPRLDPARVTVTACFLRDDHPAGDRLRQAGVPTVFLGRGRWDPRAVGDVLDLARRHRTEVIHAAGQKGILVGRVAARRVGARTLVHLHDLYPLAAAPRALLRATARWTDAALGISRAVARHGVHAYALPADRVRVLYNGVDADRFTPPSPDAGARWRAAHGLEATDRTVGVIGRLSPVKGHARLLDRWPRILDGVPAARLVVIGDGPLRPDLERRVAALGAGATVRFAGSQHDMAAALAALDLVVIPSDHEGLSYVALEAMAAGKPVVAVASGGVREALGEGEWGALVDPADPGALGDAVVDLLQDPDRAAALARRARQELPRFSLERHVDELQRIYRELARTTRPARAGSAA